METVTVTYLGPSGARHLVRCGVLAKRGEAVEVPAEYAKELEGNPDWKIGSKVTKPAGAAGAGKE